MLNNDIMKSLRYMLNLSNEGVVSTCALAGGQITAGQVDAFLSDDEDPSRGCPDEVLAQFLDGVIILKRGKDDSKPRPATELPISNNQVIKKLRVAFQLHEDKLLAIMASSGFEFGKPELSAILRSRGHRNYRAAGDQVLRNFLRGLTTHVQGGLMVGR
jgi:uncharacterized protein YehS (DUF1456 family)